MSIEPAEDIAKAICSDKFDPNTGEISGSVFTGAGSSVSQLSLCPLEGQVGFVPPKGGKAPVSAEWRHSSFPRKPAFE
jgi:hypothetical protein